MPKSWALLIGVGVNVDKRNLAEDGSYTDTSLPGAVPDIVAAEACLKTAAEDVETIKLTASKSSDYNTSGRLIEGHESLPTQANVIAALLKIIKQGKPGEHVYIHFSGHGTRMSVENTDSQAVALVLFDPGEFGASYLHGERLRKAVERMTGQGMFVTIVLDCCFSGSVLRHDLENGTVRFMEYDAAVDAASDSALCSESLGFRDATMKHAHLLDPDKYIVLAACSPSQSAREGLIGGGVRRGALSYFLYNSISALRKRGARISHVALHQHLCASFRARLSAQSPMLLGKSQQSFWKHLIPQSKAPLVSVYHEVSTNRLVLAAGQAHGVHQGDEYALYSYYTEESQRAHSEPHAKVKVVKVESLTSELEAPESARASLAHHETTWEAKLVSSYSAQKIQVALPESLHLCKGIEDGETHHPYMELVTNSMQQSDTTAYRVAQDEQLNYTIQNAANRRVPGLPLISSQSDGAKQRLINVLGHMSSFKYFETIENSSPDPGFEQEFSLDMPSVGVDGYITVEHGDDIQFEFRNLGKHPKYLSIFLLKSSWDIVNLTYDLGDDHWIEIPGSTTSRRPEERVLPIPLTMELSDNKSPYEEDTFKFVITSKPTVFPENILPKVDNEGLRGSKDQVSVAVEKLLLMSQGELRDEEQENWSTRTALVRTVLRK